jgi:tRNA pseudouridine13 synthase
MNCLPRAYKGRLITADLRTISSDFRVTEVLSFPLSGSGEHLFIYVEKQDCNTDWVIRQLCKTLNLTTKHIGYAGKKDRHSISRQWFSLHLPGKDIDINDINCDAFKVIESARHNKKLRVGSLAENQFKIILRNVSAPFDPNIIEQIKYNGVPNYFGMQRFGINGANLDKAELLLKGEIKIKNRNKRGITISSARSFLFNLMLAERIKQQNWNVPIGGDCLMLDGSRSFFHCQQPQHNDIERVSSGDAHVSGFLVGKQDSETTGGANDVEQVVSNAYESWISGLKKLNLDSARRAFRVIPRQLEVKLVDDKILLEFSLSKGCYATSVIREFADITDKQLVVAEEKKS